MTSSLSSKSSYLMRGQVMVCYPCGDGAPDTILETIPLWGGSREQTPSDDEFQRQVEETKRTRRAERKERLGDTSH